MKEVLLGNQVRDIHFFIDSDAVDDIYLFNRIIIDTGQLITLRSNIDTDEILYSIDSRSDSEIINALQFKDYNEKRLVGFWECKNSQGYLDQIVLGFDLLRPSLLISCECGLLGVFSTNPINRKILNL